LRGRRLAWHRIKCKEHNSSNWIIGSTGTCIQFGIVNWHQKELQKPDRKTGKLPTIHGWHHPKADADRLYVPRKQGGGGMPSKNYKTSGICRQQGR